MIESLLYAIVYLVVLGVIGALALWVLDEMPIPDPPRRIIRILVIVILVVAAILLLLRFIPLPGLNAGAI